MNLYILVISIVIASVFVGLFLILINTRKPKAPSQNPILTKSSIMITSQDIKAIAGDDVLSTQLDLARAYIEMGKKQLAKKILDHVAKNGNDKQQQEAHGLIDEIAIYTKQKNLSQGNT